MEYQKLRTDNLLLKGKSKDFIKFCKIKPYRNSFYLSFGISLFESLIRSKKSIITQASINNLTQFTRRILPYFEQQRSFLTEISNILNTLNEQDYKTALELIDLYMTQNNGKEPEVMDKIMRVLMMASSNLNFSLLDVETWLTQNVSHNKEMIQNFVNQLNINLYILTNTETTKFKSDKQTDSPLVFVYQYDKRFGVPYHKEYDELDVNPNLNVECYPFILMNSTKKSNKKESTKISHIQREIIEEFASLLIGHGIIDLSESLKKQISGLIQGDPRYKHTRLQELIEKASKTESGVNPMTDGLSQSTASNNEKNVIKELDCIAPINQSLQSEVPDVKSAHPEECESCKLPINSDKILFECLHLIHPKCYTKCKLCPKCAKHL